MEVLAKQKNTKAFIILSAGFHEENEEGAKLERQIVETINSVGGSLIGPNCIGVLTNHYSGVFTSPIPELNPQGVDLISGSGATALFIMDSGMQKGIKFNSMYSVGNSAQLGVEEILEYMDESFDPKTSSRVKLLYVESIEKPEKLLKHASSLIRKGCRIALLPGTSELLLCAQLDGHGENPVGGKQPQSNGNTDQEHGKLVSGPDPVQGHIAEHHIAHGREGMGKGSGIQQSAGNR